MKDTERVHERDLMREAFLAGWQAALAVTVSHPGVLAVIDSCFEQWLEDAADEVDVLGLPFRRREDLPGPAPVSRVGSSPGDRRARRHGTRPSTATG